MPANYIFTDSIQVFIDLLDVIVMPSLLTESYGTKFCCDIDIWMRQGSWLKMLFLGSEGRKRCGVLLKNATNPCILPQNATNPR